MNRLYAVFIVIIIISEFGIVSPILSLVEGYYTFFPDPTKTGIKVSRKLRFYDKIGLVTLIGLSLIMVILLIQIFVRKKWVINNASV